MSVNVFNKTYIFFCKNIYNKYSFNLYFKNTDIEYSNLRSNDVYCILCIFIFCAKQFLFCRFKYLNLPCF